MTVSASPDYLFKACLIVSVLFFSVILFMSHEHSQHKLQIFISSIKPQEEIFIEETLKTTIDSQYNGQVLGDLCLKTNWTEGLIFDCYGLEGGLGNVRNIFLNCVRYTIEAGAAFIIPKITARSPENLAALKTGNNVDFGTFFDSDHLVSTLQQGCPQMRIYNDSNELWDQPTTANPLILKPNTLAEEVVVINSYSVLAKPEKWRGQFDSWLHDQLNQTEKPPPSYAAPLLVTVHQPFMEFPTTYDPPSFVANFGLILRPRPDICALTAAVLRSLSGTYSLDINPVAGIPRNAYLGIHLRTASDASNAGWVSYADQAAFYFSQAHTQNLSLIYVASGDPDSTKRFRSEARTFRNIEVTTKHDLLSGEDLEAMKKLSWDQQALIDYEIMLRSSYFAGIYQSSFAWNVALRRHVAGKSYRWDSMAGVRGQAFDDEYSQIYGPPGAWPLFEATMWP